MHTTSPITRDRSNRSSCEAIVGDRVAKDIQPTVLLPSGFQPNLQVIFCDRTAVAKTDGLQFPSDKRFPKGHILLRCELAQNPVALARHMYRNLTSHPGCRRSRTRGIREDMQIRERK